MVTITDTRVTGDLREATVYYTVFGETVDAVPDTAGGRGAGQRDRRPAVEGRRGHRHPAHPHRWRSSPTRVPDEARRMEELLARTRESDAEVARLAVGARHAGEPDPYRAPREDAEDED